MIQYLAGVLNISNKGFILILYKFRFIKRIIYSIAITNFRKAFEQKNQIRLDYATLTF